MKTRIISLLLLLLVLVALVTHDTNTIEPISKFLSPIKEAYQKVTSDTSNAIDKYFFQTDTISKLSIQNEILQKQLLDQSHYIRQLANIHQTLPSLQQYPVGSVALAQTISYVKLNSLSQIILSKPKDIVVNKLYGLVHNGVVGGIAKSDGGQFYGYLATDEKCHFAVFVGEGKAPGIAKGTGEELIAIHFIPKWHDIQEGDNVVTSGLDNIFFSNIPVGKVTKIETQSSYKVAYVKPYGDILHPKIFFVLLDARPTLLFDFDVSSLVVPKTQHPKETPMVVQEVNETIESVDEIPEVIDQTQEEVLHPEPSPAPSPVPSVQPKPKPKPSTTLDMF